MSNLLKVLLALFVLLSAVQPLPAAPDEISNKLMDEPLSLMDYGCFKTELEANAVLKETPVALNNMKMFGRCEYNYDTDKIDIKVVLTYFPLDTQSKLNWQELKTTVESIYTAVAACKPFWAAHFFHRGYNSSNFKRTPEFVKDVEHKFKISFDLFPATIIAEEKDGKLMFFDVNDKNIAK